MFPDYGAEMLLERDFGFFHRFLFMSFAAFSDILHRIIQDADQDDRYEIDRAQSEKIRLSSQYSDDQGLQHEKVDTEQKKKVFFHRSL